MENEIEKTDEENTGAINLLHSIVETPDGETENTANFSEYAGGTMQMFLNMAMEMRNDMKEAYEERLKEILRKWDESKNLPRKAKKKMRKELLLDFSINEYGKDLFMF